MKKLILVFAFLSINAFSIAQKLVSNKFIDQKLLTDISDETVFYGGLSKKTELWNIYKFYQIDINSSIIDTLSFVFHKKQKLISGALNPNGYFCLSEANKGIYLYKINGNQKILLTQFNWKSNSMMKSKLHDDGENLYLLRSDMKKFIHILSKISYDGETIWEKTLNGSAKRERVYDLFFTNSSIHTVMSTKPSSNKKDYILKTINKDNSKHFDTKLNNNSRVNSIDLMKVVNDDLFIVGRTHSDIRINQREAKQYYFAKLNIEKQTFDYTIDENNELSDIKVLWQDLVYSNGDLVLIGEVFDNTSKGSAIAQQATVALLTGGQFVNSVINIKVKDAVFTHINKGFSEVIINSELPTKSYTNFGDLASFNLAGHAKQKGVFRFQGMTTQGAGLFRVDDSLYIIDVRSGLLTKEVPNFRKEFKILGIIGSSLICGLENELLENLNIMSFDL